MSSKKSSTINDKSMNKSVKINTKSRCRKVADNDAKMTEKGSTMEPEGVPKVDKIDVNFEV